MTKERRPPLLSVIIPTQGIRPQLLHCLEAVRDQSLSMDQREVIVAVDGESSTVEKQLAGMSGGGNFKVCSQPRRGPAAARNMGARKAKGDFVVFTDDDCIPEKDWLVRLEDRLQANPDCGVGGALVNHFPDNPYSEATQILFEVLGRHYNSCPQKARFLTSNNLAFPRKAFLDSGGFDERFRIAAGEDREFCARWLSSGLGLIFAREVRVSHSSSLSLKSFIQKHYDYGRGAYWFRQKRKRSGHKMPLESLSFYVRLVACPGPKRFHLCLLLALSQCCTAVGFTLAGPSRRPDQLYLLFHS